MKYGYLPIDEYGNVCDFRRPSPFNAYAYTLDSTGVPVGGEFVQPFCNLMKPD